MILEEKPDGQGDGEDSARLQAASGVRKVGRRGERGAGPRPPALCSKARPGARPSWLLPAVPYSILQASTGETEAPRGLQSLCPFSGLPPTLYRGPSLGTRKLPGICGNRDLGHHFPEAWD